MVVEAKREVDFEHLRGIDSKLRTDFLVSSVVQLKERNPGMWKIPATPKMACKLSMQACTGAWHIRHHCRRDALMVRLKSFFRNGLRLRFYSRIS